MIATLPRSSSQFVTPVQLRLLLKTNLGLNARQVSVCKGSSLTYLTVTVRDPSVDVEEVRKFVSTFNTWNMDNTDYVTGQSVHVETSREVDQAHAAPFLAEIATATAALLAGEPNTVHVLSNGKRLWRSDGEFHVVRDADCSARGTYIREYNVAARDAWALEALALQMARV